MGEVERVVVMLVPAIVEQRVQSSVDGYGDA